MTSDGLRSVLTNLHDVQGKHPPLTADEEKSLCKEYGNDRDGLQEQLVLHNVGFAIAYVRKYSERTEEREDLWMRGLQGLSAAARKFDPSRGIRFCTFAAYYIQKAMCDLFDPHSAAPKTQLATQAAYDAPLKQDETSESTAGDYFVTRAAAPGWEPVRPDAEAGRRSAESGVAELVEYLANRFGWSASERDVIRARFVGWSYEEVGRRILGVSKQAAHQRCEALMRGMCRVIGRLKRGDELYGLFNMAVKAVPKDLNPAQLHEFVVSKGVEIADDVEYETLENRKVRLAEEYDDAEAAHRLATGRRGEGGADYALMRAIYMDTVVGTSRIGDVARRRGMPQTYAEFLRDRAVRMVKQAKDGIFRKLVERQDIHGVSLEEHRIKDELFNFASYPPGSGCGGGGAFVTRYDRVAVARRERRVRRRLLITWKNYGGGFYSEASYLHMSGRIRNGKTRLTKREVRALAQFCDEPT